MKTIKSLALSLLLLSTASQASIVTTGEFTGDHSEGFENVTSAPFVDNYVGLFGGNADAFNLFPDDGDLHITGGWHFHSYIGPHSGGKLAGTAGGNWSFEFDQATNAFGGFFGTNSVAGNVDAPNGLASLFDINDNLLAEFEIDLGLGGSWAWNGWQSSENNIAKVTLSSGFTDPNVVDGGFLMLDDLQLGLTNSNLTSVPEPTALALLLSGLLLLTRRQRHTS